MALLSSHTLSGSPGLMLGPAQCPWLHIILGPSATSGGSCLCQVAKWDLALELFAWLQWLSVTRVGWPEEKQFGHSTCHGAGFALWDPL